MNIGPARVVSEITGPVKVLHDDKVIKTFGSVSTADAFAQGYNVAWWRAMEVKKP